MSDQTIKKIIHLIINIPKNLVLLCINIYRRAVSPLLPPSCRFIPTCSEYAMTALKKYGFLKGIWLTVKRISRCHPWHPGGYDPVP